MTVFSTNLEIALQKLGISQAELAERSGLTPAAISQLLSGHREPMLGTFLKVCTGLNLTPNDLLDFHSESRTQMRHKLAILQSRMAEIADICGSEI